MTEEKSLVKLKNEIDDFAVEFEVIPAVDESDSRRVEIRAELKEVEDNILYTQNKLDKINSEIDRLTNQADGIDYALAVTCGLITGIIDAAFVGEWDFKKAKDESSKDINNKVISYAKKDPRYAIWCNYTDKGNLRVKPKDPDRLPTAIEFLEEKYKLPGDSEWDVKTQIVNFAKKNGFEGKGYDDAIAFLNKTMPRKGGWQTIEVGVTKATHHLDDFCHHPTLVGLVCCIVVQFTGITTYSNSQGVKSKFYVDINEYGKFVSEEKWGKVFAGVINWFFNVASTINNREGHLFSDMAGSLSSANKGNIGAGLPGSFISTAKELASLDIFKDTNFNENLRKAYQNGIGNGPKQLDLGIFNSLFEGAKTNRVDMRTEMAVASELKRQSVPVIINEVLVRGLYFVRRFVEQLKSAKTLNDLDWKAMLPLRNRTIVRMMTIASGTFTAFDMADAAIETAVRHPEACVDITSFMSKMILRVNFVGIGRFGVAIVTDASMGVVRGIDVNKRMKLCQEQIEWSEAKLYYKEADMWISAEDTGKAVQEAYETAEKATQYYAESIAEIEDNMAVISEELPEIASSDPEFASDIKNILNWG